MSLLLRAPYPFYASYTAFLQGLRTSGWATKTRVGGGDSRSKLAAVVTSYCWLHHSTRAPSTRTVPPTIKQHTNTLHASELLVETPTTLLLRFYSMGMTIQYTGSHSHCVVFTRGEKAQHDAGRAAGNKNPSGSDRFPPCAVGGEPGRGSDDRRKKTKQASDHHRHRDLPHGHPLRRPPTLSS